MNGFVAVLGREVRERRLLLVVSGLVGLLSLAAPLLPGVPGDPLSQSHARGGTALVVAGLLSLAWALLLGGTVIASDLGERRLGFYFARPLSAWAIWAGKLTAAFALTAASALLVLAPSFLLGDRIDPGGTWQTGLLYNVPLEAPSLEALACAVGLGLLLLLANAVAIAARSHSLWLLLDLALAGVAAALVTVAARRLLYAFAGGAFVLGLAALLLALLAALLAGSASQMLFGRTDARRSHRFLSLALWIVVLPSALGFDAYAQWVLNPAVADLTRAMVVAAAPAGPWTAVAGPTAHRNGYRALFLFDTATGRGLPLPATVRYVAFAGDGSRAVFLMPQGDPRSTPYELFTLDLERPGARPVRTRLALPLGLYDDLALAPDARRLATLEKNREQGDRLTLEEIATGRLLAAAQLHGSSLSDELRILPDGTVRLFRKVAGAPLPGGRDTFDLEVSELAPGGRLTPLCRIPRLDVDRVLLPSRSWSVSPDGAALLTETLDDAPNRHTPRLFDARTGRQIAALAASTLPDTFDFLPDARIVQTTIGRSSLDLQVWSPTGAPLARFHLPAAALSVIGGLIAPDRLLVGLPAYVGPTYPEHTRTFLLDLTSGGVHEVGRDVGPALRWIRERPNGPLARLLAGPGHGLSRLDPETLRWTVLLPTASRIPAQEAAR